jgi:hypothetical protein
MACETRSLFSEHAENYNAHFEKLGHASTEATRIAKAIKGRDELNHLLYKTPGLKEFHILKTLSRAGESRRNSEFVLNRNDAATLS